MLLIIAMHNIENDNKICVNSLQQKPSFFCCTALNKNRVMSHSETRQRQAATHCCGI